MAGKIVADQLEHSTAGSIATNFVVEGSAKMVIDASQDPQGINDSFNVSSIADGGTGKTEATLTNVHSTVNYAPVHSVHSGNNRMITVISHTASVVKYECFQESTYNNAADSAGISGNTHGDLA